MALNDAAIDEGLRSLNGWTRDGDTIRRDLTFGSFREAISFIVRIAFEAEQRDHHPDLANVYNRVTIRLSTHDAGGITEKDFDLARAIDRITWTT
ncbi:MAG: 4a-hydroxytetrahydrobiopterin dehydratase [Dehalococcoidia bacterium]